MHPLRSRGHYILGNLSKDRQPPFWIGDPSGRSKSSASIILLEETPKRTASFLRFLIASLAGLNFNQSTLSGTAFRIRIQLDHISGFIL